MPIRAAQWIAASSLVAVASLIAVAALPGTSEGHAWSSASAHGDTSATAVQVRPNIVLYNLDDLRDAFPGGFDPLDYMPKTSEWMATGRRYRNTFVSIPSCCPSRSSLMTGLYPHNNGVQVQSQGPAFDFSHSVGCYLQSAGYATYVAGKFLTTWPAKQRPPCFEHSTVIFGGYEDVNARVDGMHVIAPGYSTTYLGAAGRDYILSALSTAHPFFLYETPQAPHTVEIRNPDGTITRLAIPEPRYADAPVGSCAGVREQDRSDKPAYVRHTSVTRSFAQGQCESMLRALRTADDEFAATMRLLSDRGVLDDTLVILTSDNGFMYGEHGRTSKFVPYEPSIRVPLMVRWPDHLAAGIETERLVSSVDLMPTILQAAGLAPPADAPRLDGESLLRPSTRTTAYAEYFADPVGGSVLSWRVLRTDGAKYIETYAADGRRVFREYYDLRSDPAENKNLLNDSDTSNDPPEGVLVDLATTLRAMSTCSGVSCVR